MFVLGHAGISALVAYTMERALTRSGATSSAASARSGTTKRATPTGLPVPAEISRRANSGVRIDYRLVLLGAMLPDLIDKPLALWILPDVFGSTRSIGHTALFGGLLLLLAGLVLACTGKRGLMVLALASAGHLLLDGIWSVPEILWWPYHGWSFEPDGIQGVWRVWLVTLYTEPLIYVPEVIGGLGLMVMVFRLWRRRAWAYLLRQGRLT